MKKIFKKNRKEEKITNIYDSLGAINFFKEKAEIETTVINNNLYLWITTKNEKDFEKFIDICRQYNAEIWYDIYSYVETACYCDFSNGQVRVYIEK